MVQSALASNCFETGESSLKHYKTQGSRPQVIDLVIGNLPENFEAENLKRISGCKQVIGATIEVDNLRGVCNGTGRIQVRLNNGETADQLVLNFEKQGFQVKEFEKDNRLKPNAKKEKIADKVTNPKVSKMNNNKTSEPVIFGNAKVSTRS